MIGTHHQRNLDHLRLISLDEQYFSTLQNSFIWALVIKQSYFNFSHLWFIQYVVSVS